MFNCIAAVQSSCSICGHPSSLVFSGIPFVFTRVPFVSTRVPFVFTRVHLCSLVFTNVHSCSDSCGVLDQIVRFSQYPSCILDGQNVAILYTISRQIAISTNIENAERVQPLSKQT